MKQIVCISCVKSKRPYKSRVAELYTSTLFIKLLRYAESLHPDRIFVLSAEHGVLGLDDIIEPYEKTLNSSGITERKLWAQKVLAQLKIKADLQTDKFIFLAGKNYREHLTPYIKHYIIPMQGLPIGKQLGWLKERVG